MKRIYNVLFLLFAVIFSLPLFAQNSNVGIGTTTPDASAVLDVTSNTQGMLVPRMHTTQRLGIASPAQGLLVYDTDLGCFYYYNSTAWISLCQAGPAGPTGAQGAAGPTGPGGANGNNGATGPSGADGAPGASGPAGPTGANGAPGAPGATGATGATGPGGAGSIGATGPQGVTGATGASGVPGTQGPTGPQGNAGVAGPTGPQGVAGNAGSVGATGPAGPTGAGAALNIQSVSVTANTTLSATSFTNLSPLTLTFTPTKSQTFIEFTASGAGQDNSAEIAYFQIVVNGTVVGGCASQAAMTNTWDGYSLFGWNVAFSKLVTVNPNVSNTVTVQYYSDAVVGSSGLFIQPAARTTDHGTLSAFVQ